MNQTFRRFSQFLSAAALLLVPAMAGATVHFTDDATVSRGDFIRSAVSALGITAADVNGTMPYTRVAPALLPAIRAAHQEGALAAFGEDLSLARPILRGEAVTVLQELTDAAGNTSVSFRDAPAGSKQAWAIAIAIDKKWLGPVSESSFGWTRLLTGADAANMIEVAAGTTAPRSATTPPKTITVQFKGNEPVSKLAHTELLQKVWEIIEDDYVKSENIDAEEASYRAIEALVESLDDPYSRFLRPQSANNFATQISGEVSGIGAQVEDREGVLTIVTPLTGSPAEKAGLRPNDQILAVNGESLKGLDFLDAVDKIRGPRGSEAKLTILRDGAEMSVTLTRDVVKVPEIEVKWQGKIAIVQLMQFGRRTQTELRGIMRDVQAKNPDGIVLDLRNNPGGLLDAANVVLSNFLPADSQVATIKMRNSTRYDRTIQPATIDADVPLAVLVNAGSASASEIVAGALQDAERATIIGEKTFGKGTVQEILQFNDGSSLKLTVAEWLTPHGRHIDGVGVEPDIAVAPSGLQERDAQLLKALDVLLR